MVVGVVVKSHEPWPVPVVLLELPVLVLPLALEVEEGADAVMMIVS